MEEINYKQAKEELENIIIEIESGNVDIDTLTTKIKRAGELILYCKNKLIETEESVENILKSFNTDNNITKDQ